MDFKEFTKSKEKGGAPEPKKKEARMGILKDIRDMAMGSMGDEIKGLKKVSVMAEDKKGLEKGLETAKEVVDGSEEEGLPFHADKLHSDKPHVESDKVAELCEEAKSLSKEDLERLIAELQTASADME